MPYPARVMYFTPRASATASTGTDIDRSKEPRGPERTHAVTRPLSIRSLHAEIWKRFQAYRGRFTVSCILTLVSSLFNAAGFGLMIPLVGLIIGEGDALGRRR